jgi:anhydro-N-acetylmuramic acid kinase
MKKNHYHVIGVMSGTSLDGIDLAEIEFYITDKNTSNNTWRFDIRNSRTYPYTSLWKERLQHAISFNEDELTSLDGEYTAYLSEVILDFINDNELHSLDAICSHGHTILHQPENGRTLQIGNQQALSKFIGQKLVCDFRVQDVALGGQGAPLVPIGDELLFGEYDYCLNLGGFANVSKRVDGKRKAYDLCPVNILLNQFAEKLGKPYDDRGSFAKSGMINLELLNQLNGLPFYKKSPPKSLGLEWVQRCVFPLLEVTSITSEDMLRTLVEHFAIQIAGEFREGTSVLITGGGAYNSFLMERIRHHKQVNIIIPSNEIVEFKEALIFGLLGVLKLRGEVNCLGSVTGAENDHSSGIIFFP